MEFIDFQLNLLIGLLIGRHFSKRLLIKKRIWHPLQKHFFISNLATSFWLRSLDPQGDLGYFLGPCVDQDYLCKMGPWTSPKTSFLLVILNFKWFLDTFWTLGWARLLMHFQFVRFRKATFLLVIFAKIKHSNQNLAVRQPNSRCNFYPVPLPH